MNLFLEVFQERKISSSSSFFVWFFPVCWGGRGYGLHAYLLCESFICRVIVTFGLNALYGRHKLKGNAWGGDWDSSNARSLMKYSISKGYQIDSWELGMD